jgi:hypothetical protein
MHLDFTDSEITVAVLDNWDFEHVHDKLSKEGPIVFSDPSSRVIIFQTKTWQVPIFERMAGIFFVNYIILNKKA